MFRIGVAVIAATNLAACATVTRGTKQKFEITSEPSEANVELSIGDKCVTPCKLKLKRKEAFVATFTKEGYEKQAVNVRSKFGGGGAAAGAGNILLGGFIGAGVDASNGSLNNLDPNPLHAVLKPMPSQEPAPAADENGTEEVANAAGEQSEVGQAVTDDPAPVEGEALLAAEEVAVVTEDGASN